MHSKRFVHRDIKLENILLKRVNHGQIAIVLADFGLTISRDNKEPYDRLQGTELYLSPEALKQRRNDEYADDVWSCGVVAFVLMNGDFPFTNKNDIKQMKFQMKFSEQSRQYWAEHPEWFKGFTRKTLVPEEKRSSVLALKEDLGGEPDSTYFSDADSNLEREPALKKQKC